MIDSTSKEAELEPEHPSKKPGLTLAPFFRNAFKAKNSGGNSSPYSNSAVTHDGTYHQQKQGFDLTLVAARLTHDRPLVRPQDDELDMQELPEDTEHADEHTNQQPFMSDTLAEIMKKQGKFDEARKAYFQLLRTNPKRALYYQTQIAALDVLQSRAE